MKTTETSILERRNMMLKHEATLVLADRRKRQVALRKLIRFNIKDIYFFGRECSRDDMSRYVWR